MAFVLVKEPVATRRVDAVGSQRTDSPLQGAGVTARENMKHRRARFQEARHQVPRPIDIEHVLQHVMCKHEVEGRHRWVPCASCGQREEVAAGESLSGGLERLGTQVGSGNRPSRERFPQNLRKDTLTASEVQRAACLGKIQLTNEIGDAAFFPSRPIVHVARGISLVIKTNRRRFLCQHVTLPFATVVPSDYHSRGDRVQICSERWIAAAALQ